MRFVSLMIFTFMISSIHASSIVVDPRVNGVLRSYDLINAQGDFYRAILTNSELEPCLVIDKVNLRSKKGPKVLQVSKFCTFVYKGKKYSLMPDKQQEVEVLEVIWEKSKLKFTMNFMPASKSASLWPLECKIDPKKTKKDFACTEGHPQ